MARVAKQKPFTVLSGIGAGAGGALAMLATMALLRFAASVPTVPELMLSPILKLMGGEAFSAALDNLFFSGRPLLFTVILEGTLLLGALLGLLYARLVRPNPASGRRAAIFNTPLPGIVYGLVIGLLLNVVFLPLVGLLPFAESLFGPQAQPTIPLWVGLFVEALVFGVTVHGLLPRVRAAGPTSAAEPLPATHLYIPPAQSAERRQFLRITGGALLALIGGAAFWYGGTVLNQGGLTSPVNRKDLAGKSGDGAGGADGGASAPAGTDAGGGGSGAEALGQASPSAEPSTGTPGTPTPETRFTATVRETPLAPTETAAPVPTDIPVSQQPAITAAPAEPTATLPPPPSPPPTDTPQPPPTSTSTPPPTATATAAVPPTAIAALPVIKVAEITPNESFYHISKNFFDPSPGANGWKLEFKGMVNKPYSITYPQLIAMPAIGVTTGMMCISNPVGGSLIGSTNWKGVRLADLIKKADPQGGVVDVLMRAVDDYSDSIPYKKALDPNVMLVWEMGGAPLTSQHGFPARLLVPGIYGMKHVKWITSFELVNFDYKGFWQEPSQGWSDPAPVNTMSRIDFPSDGTLTLRTYNVSGVAFAGDRSISKVEVSTDGGKTWDPAYLRPPKSKTSWAVWGFRWTPPKPGRYKLMVRATDGTGKLQAARRTDPYPNGATGYHTVTYNVTAQ